MANTRAKVYITTTALVPDIPLADDGHRRHEHNWKTKLLDICIKRCRVFPDKIEIMGIVTPERLRGGVTEYDGIPVQGVETTLSPGHEDYEDAKRVSDARLHTAKLYKSRMGDRVLRIPKNEDVRNIFMADSEHHLLFRYMEVETPCVVIDGDVLFAEVHDLNFELSGCVTGTELVSIVKPEDRKTVLLNEKFTGNRAGINERVRFTHMYAIPAYALWEVGIL